MERLAASISGLTAAPPGYRLRPLTAAAALVFALGISSVAVPTGLAKAPPGGLDVQQSSYFQALSGARKVLDAAGLAETERAARALIILKAGAPGEDEVQQFLQAQPPDTADARARLDTNIAAFQQSARDPNPVVTEQRLRQILAQSRYHPDEGPLAAIGRFLARVLEALFKPGQGVFSVILLLLLAGLVVLVLVLLVPALRNPLLRRRGAPPGVAGGPDAVPEYFATADRLAAEGNFGAAVRALVAGTMELVSGERSFTASPLTVRETFGRSGAMLALRPLLQAFERSYYGHHDAGRADYEAAAAAAREYRALLLQRRAAA
ncbi:MAG TPA: hypothetical protein VGR61_08725 [Candidatus Dormibacteraeota bacterium]|nr:hypothetical protein [Candidatus Dormibacteraeota bacterium]